MPFDPRLALIALAAIASAVLALALAASLWCMGSALAFDPVVLRRLSTVVGVKGADVSFARDATAFGNDVTLWTVAVLASMYLAAGRRWRDCVQLIAASAVGGLLTFAVKEVVGRARPAVVPHLVDVHSLSFPSGHATNSTFVYGTLALIVGRYAASDRQRACLGFVVVTLSVAIGCSRLILGVHWPSDVLAGWSIGASWALMVDALTARAFSTPTRAPHRAADAGTH